MDGQARSNAVFMRLLFFAKGWSAMILLGFGLAVLTVIQGAGAAGTPAVNDAETGAFQVESADIDHDVLPEDSFSAEAIVLMDAQTGQILFSKQAERQLYPASITKIMTALLALESEQLDELVTVSARARRADGNRIYLSEGESKPLGDLVYGLMLNSGNDAAIAIAEHLAGSVEQFAVQMNEKARALGAQHTHFVNPHGLPDEEHYTTAYDMAQIARHALQNPLFREVVSTQTMPWQGEEWVSTLVNTNRLLWNYEGMNGIKTGYTHAAGHTFVGSAQRGDTELVVVLLKAASRNLLWAEASALLDYGFENYETIQLYTAGDLISVERYGQEHVFKIEDDLYVTQYTGDPFQPVEHIRWLDRSPLPKPEIWQAEYVIEVEGKAVAQVPLSYRFTRGETVAGTNEASGETAMTRSGAGTGHILLWSGFPKWPLALPFLLISYLLIRRRRKRKASILRVESLSSRRYTSRHWPPVS